MNQKGRLKRPPFFYSGAGIWDLGFGIWDLGFGIWDLGFGIWDLGFGIWDLGFGIWDLGFEQIVGPYFSGCQELCAFVSSW
jgi:hypothetical protein